MGLHPSTSEVCFLLLPVDYWGSDVVSTSNQLAPSTEDTCVVSYLLGVILANFFLPLFNMLTHIHMSTVTGSVLPLLWSLQIPMKKILSPCFCIFIYLIFVWKKIWGCSMMPSPSKSVRFHKDSLPVPLKGVLKKPEVVIPVWVGLVSFFVWCWVVVWVTANLRFPSLCTKAGMKKKTHFLGTWLSRSSLKIIFYNTCHSTPTPSPKKASTSIDKEDDDEADLWSNFKEIDYVEEATAKKK